MSIKLASSNRSFGLVFAAFFVMIGLLPLLHAKEMHAWAVGVGLAVLACTFIRPVWLTPFNQLWTALGVAIGKVTTPLIMGGVFVIVMIPMAIVLRLLGKTPLAFKYSAESTYWKKREPLTPESFDNQF